MIRNIASVDEEYRSHLVSSPSPHVATATTSHFAVGRGISLSAIVTAVTIRDGNNFETLLGWAVIYEVLYTMWKVRCHGSRRYADSAIYMTNRNWGTLSRSVVVGPKTRLPALECRTQYMRLRQSLDVSSNVGGGTYGISSA
jgi:hypothetical protein